VDLPGVQTLADQLDRRPHWDRDDDLDRLGQDWPSGDHVGVKSTVLNTMNILAVHLTARSTTTCPPGEAAVLVIHPFGTWALDGPRSSLRPTDPRARDPVGRTEQYGKGERRSTIDQNLRTPAAMAGQLKKGRAHLRTRGITMQLPKDEATTLVDGIWQSQLITTARSNCATENRAQKGN
jgi:hypothetical protein